MTTENPSSSTSPKTKRRIVIITGGVLLFFSLYLLVFLVPDVIQTASGAEAMTMERAGEIATTTSHYAYIEDPMWHCDTITYFRRRSSTSSTQTIRLTEIFVTDANQSIVMLTQLSGELSCLDFDGMFPQGYLTRMSADTQQALTNDARLAQFFDATVFLEFCGYCGQENSLIGAIFGGVIGLAGVFVLGLGLRMPSDRKSKST